MELNTKSIKKILLTVALSAIIVSAVVRYDLVLDALSWIFSVFAPFIIGFCLFFVLNVLLKAVEDKWQKIFKKSKSDIFTSHQFTSKMYKNSTLRIKVQKTKEK